MNKQAFTLLEAIIVIVLIGIIGTFAVSTGFFQAHKDKIYLGRDFIISMIRYTENKAYNNDNYRLYYNNNTEKLLTKYYFKNFYHIKIFKDTDNQIKMIIFRDQNFDNDIKDNYVKETVKGPNNLYLSGKYNESGYPDSSETLTKLNLTKNFDIISFDVNNKDNLDLLFDKYGNIYLNEGKKGSDAGDLYIYDHINRPLLKDSIDLEFKDNKGQCVKIKIYKYGNIEKENC